MKIFEVIYVRVDRRGSRSKPYKLEIKANDRDQARYLAGYTITEDHVIISIKQIEKFTL